jgi:hypothetical protein
MLYSKLGSIPKPETDGTKGWIEVEEPPTAGDGEEVVWWFPPGWVVRPVKPEGDWNWSQSEERWVEGVVREQETNVEQEIVVVTETATATAAIS